MIGRSAAIAMFLASIAFSGHVQAGGPLQVRGNGQPYVWSTAADIQYRTDNGPLSGTVSESSAQSRVVAMFNVWESVPTASIAYNRAGFISAVGAFAGGDVDTPAEYAAVENDCFNGNQSPVVYDQDGSIIVDLGLDETSVIGFAGPCAATASNIVSGRIVMNGRFQGGPSGISAAEFDAAIIHEIGHFSGLDHSQINVNCLGGCGADDLAGLPTMFPLLLDSSQGALSTDDVAWISRLYPAPSFATAYGTISGVVLFSDGDSHAQLVNVIARPLDTGQNQDRAMAVSSASGIRFRVIHGNPITNPAPSADGTEAPGDIGLFEIPVPAGSYTLEVESIHPAFDAGSSIGGPVLIPMPGSAPAPVGPVIVPAGTTVSGNDVILIGTPPRFDQFEGP
ncbi:MAG TPA: hypothetical protein VH856_04570 [Steroidobacteraceae bacterium]